MCGGLRHGPVLWWGHHHSVSHGGYAHAMARPKSCQLLRGMVKRSMLKYNVSRYHKIIDQFVILYHACCNQIKLSNWNQQTTMLEHTSNSTKRIEFDIKTARPREPMHAITYVRARGTRSPQSIKWVGWVLCDACRNHKHARVARPSWWID
jgi:hypothetical protein